MMFDVMTSFAKMRFYSHHMKQMIIMMVKNVAGLVSGAKEFCQIMSTPNSKLTETDVFGFFMYTSKWRGING